MHDNLKHKKSATQAGLYLFLAVLLTFWSGMGVVRNQPRRICDRITRSLAESTGQQKAESKQVVSGIGTFEKVQREIGSGGLNPAAPSINKRVGSQESARFLFFLGL